MGKLIYDGVVYAGGVVVDSALSTTSTNPVQNKVVAEAVNTINTHLSKYDTGTYNAGTFNANETKLTNAIAFNETFTKPPVIAVDMTGGGSALNITIVSVSNTSFSLMIQNNSGTAITSARVLTWRCLGV